METLMILVGLAFYFKAVVLAIYAYSKYEHLTEWLEIHAPLTLQKYLRSKDVKN